MTEKQLIFRDGSSEKFWNITLNGSSHTVHFGKVGTTGQRRTKDFSTDDEANKSFEKLVQQKLKKGYQDESEEAPSEQSSNDSSISKNTASKKASTRPTATKKTAKKTAKKKVAAVSQSKEENGTEPDLPPAVVVNDLLLDQTDWFWASHLNSTPLKKKKPVDFNLDKAQQELEKVRTRNYGWDLCLEKIELTPDLSREEAHFWFLAMTAHRGDLDTKAERVKFAKRVARTNTIDGNLTMDQAIYGIKNAKRIPDEILAPLASLFSPEQLIEIILYESWSKKKKSHYDDVSVMISTLCSGFAKYVLPYVSKTKLNELKKLVRESFEIKHTSISPDDSIPATYKLAGVLGLTKEVAKILELVQEDEYKNQEYYYSDYQDLQTIVGGLGSPEEIEYQWRRLCLPLDSPQHCRQFLAYTKDAALDVLADEVCNQTNKEEAAKRMDNLCLANTPTAAEPILRCRIESKAPSIAKSWLEQNVGNAVTGLLKTAGGKGKLADAAIDYLRQMKRKGYSDFIEKSIQQYPGPKGDVERIVKQVLEHEEKVYQPVDDKSAPKWVQTTFGSIELGRRKKLPTWLNVSELPPLSVSCEKNSFLKLNDQQVEIILQTLAATAITEKDPLLQAIKENIPEQVRDDFAWFLFNAWQDEGSVSKEKWAMGAIGHLGGEQSVMKLTPMIRVWPGESQHARAVYGLQCLRAVGSNTALMQLSSIAQKLKFKGLKNKAALFVEEIAKEKGMTRAELEDRVIPDCGLDQDGKREFSFGPRSFFFTLGGDLKPKVKDESGKIRATMPKPGVKDDPEIANQSLTEWKLIKKQIKEVATLQSGRLEQAMVTGRRWSLKDFESLMVKHPLMTHLVQKLIWGYFDKNGRLKDLFRVSEEKDYASVEDEEISLPKDSEIGLVHPLDLTNEQKSAWGEVLSDYEIVSPFPQLGREVYEVNKSELKNKKLSGFEDIKLAAPTMVFNLEKLGWTRGEAMDAGCFDEHSKQFPSSNATAVIRYDGIVGMGYIDPDEILKIDEIYFCPGMRDPSGYGDYYDKKKSPLKDVSAIVLSEVIADLQFLRSKMK